MGEKKKFTNDQLKNAFYTDMPCIFCGKLVEVRYANQGWSHDQCQKDGCTGKVVYPHPGADPVELDSTGVEMRLDPNDLIGALLDPEVDDSFGPEMEVEG